MDAQEEITGLNGVGFLFGLIALFLFFCGLKQTGHAAASGLAGCAVLAPATGAFHEDGDVQFALAVLLLAPLMPRSC